MLFAALLFAKQQIIIIGFGCLVAVLLSINSQKRVAAVCRVDLRKYKTNDDEVIMPCFKITLIHNTFNNDNQDFLSHRQLEFRADYFNLCV